MKKYICYTDGSYQDSIKQGGWASIILDENEQFLIRLYQGFSYTTNNRMELRAVIETLKYIEESSDITIISDSQYVLGNIKNVKHWVENNEISRANYDLWFELAELLSKHKLTFQWVKGHIGNKWNEEADKWCTFAAKCINVQKDVWTIK